MDSNLLVGIYIWFQQILYFWWQAIIRLGVRRILTSGQQGNMLEGALMIASLVVAARNRISIMPGGRSQTPVSYPFRV